MAKNINELKKNFLAYYQDVPVQRYAAEFIGRDEDTIIRWKNEDTQFADAVKKSRANWVRKKFIDTKAEFALERLEKEIFSINKNIEITRVTEIIPDPKLAERYTEFIKFQTKQT